MLHLLTSVTGGQSSRREWLVAAGAGLGCGLASASTPGARERIEAAAAAYERAAARYVAEAVVWGPELDRLLEVADAAEAALVAAIEAASRPLPRLDPGRDVPGHRPLPARAVLAGGRLYVLTVGERGPSLSVIAASAIVAA